MGPLVILNLTDADSDGVQEWLVRDARFEFAFNLCHACSPAGFRLYAWDGETYRNASAQFPDYYQEQIDDLTARVEGTAQSDEPWTGNELGPMVSLLLAYENAGRSEEGLAVFDQYSDPVLYAERASNAIAAGSASVFPLAGRQLSSERSFSGRADWQSAQWPKWHFGLQSRRGASRCAPF